VKSSAIFKAVKGVYSAGLRIPVHPVASNGPNFQHIKTKGKFHAYIPATTPTGSS